MADDIVGLMDSLGIDRAHLFAISMGGMIGQVLAATNGERLLSFFSVMSSSSRKGLSAATPEAAATLGAEVDPEAGAEGIIAATAEGLRVCGSPGYPLTETERDRIARNRHKRDYTPDGVVRQMAAIIAGGNRIKLLESIKVPTMVIHGADDPLIPLAAGKDTAETIPGAHFEVIQGMGHDLPESLAIVLIGLVTRFTRSLEQPL
jgi:proline iminopeptidase